MKLWLEACFLMTFDVSFPDPELLLDVAMTIADPLRFLGEEEEELEEEFLAPAGSKLAFFFGTPPDCTEESPL